MQSRSVFPRALSVFRAAQIFRRGFAQAKTANAQASSKLSPFAKPSAPPHSASDNQLLDLHTTLHNHYISQLSDPEASPAAAVSVERYAQIRALEDAWLTLQRETRMAAHLPETAATGALKLPTSQQDFLSWFAEVEKNYHKLTEGLFHFLEHSATKEHMAMYLAHESAVDTRFDDMIALAQLGLKDPVKKLILADNYWDEMGHGNPNGVHTTMFETAVSHFHPFLPASHKQSPQYPWQCYQNSNQILMYGLRREFQPRLLGVLTILEQTAWRRFEVLVRAFDRLGVPEHASAYHRLHATLDEEHGKQLRDIVCQPLGSSPHLLREISYGIQERLYIASDYYDGIRASLKLPNM